MSQSSPDNHPGFELPQPQLEQPVEPSVPAETAPIVSERQSRASELPGAAVPTSSPVPATAPAASALPLTNSLAAASTATSQTAASAPTVADDADLIEKEWVDKAKQIVESTRDDPHQQNKQLNAFKADYLKKRYSKEIRLSDQES